MRIKSLPLRQLSLFSRMLNALAPATARSWRIGLSGLLWLPFRLLTRPAFCGFCGFQGEEA